MTFWASLASWTPSILQNLPNWLTFRLRLSPASPIRYTDTPSHVEYDIKDGKAIRKYTYLLQSYLTKQRSLAHAAKSSGRPACPEHDPWRLLGNLTV